jgi:hypothetical protein
VFLAEDYGWAQGFRSRTNIRDVENRGPEAGSADLRLLSTALRFQPLIFFLLCGTRRSLVVRSLTKPANVLSGVEFQ